MNNFMKQQGGGEGGKKKQKKGKKPEDACVLCTERMATVMCETCAAGRGNSGFLCGKCDEEEHSQARMGQAHKPRVNLNIPLHKKPLCPKHGEKRTLYCCQSSCQRKPLLCAVCVVEGHSTHNVMSIASRCDRVRDELKKDSQPIYDVSALQRKKADLVTELEGLKRKMCAVEAALMELDRKEEKAKKTQRKMERMLEGLGVEELVDNTAVEKVRESIHSTVKELQLEGIGLREVRILMVGLDGAGKTVIQYKLKLGEVVCTIPTIGFNVETLNYKNMSFVIWDLGGQEKVGENDSFCFSFDILSSFRYLLTASSPVVSLLPEHPRLGLRGGQQRSRPHL
jgi:hypothetical protein